MGVLTAVSGSSASSRSWPAPPDPRLYVDASLDEPEVLDLPMGTAAVFTAHAPYRETNEDAAAVIPFGTDSAILVVADGAGGTRGGGVAARITVETLKGALERGVETGLPLRAAVLDGLERANQAVADLGTGAASTAAVVHVIQSRIRPYHVGDSVILVVGGRGRLKHQTVPHSPVGYAVEAGLLSERDAMHHAHRHVISNFIGSPDMRIEVGPRLWLAQRDTVLVASDGLYDNLYLEEIVAIVKRRDLAACAGELAERARERMAATDPSLPSKPDDLTFILYRPAPGLFPRRPSRQPPGTAESSG